MSRTQFYFNRMNKPAVANICLFLLNFSYSGHKRNNTLHCKITKLQQRIPTNCPNLMLRSKNLESQWAIDSTREPMGFKLNDNAKPVGPSLSRSTEAGQSTKLIVQPMFLLKQLFSST